MAKEGEKDGETQERIGSGDVSRSEVQPESTQVSDGSSAGGDPQPDGSETGAEMRAEDRPGADFREPVAPVTVTAPERTSPDRTNGLPPGRGVAAAPDRTGLAGRRPHKTILVLGGGGMRGWSHIGVIRTIERLGIVVDEVIGTSMGAVIGGLYAGGTDSHGIEQVAEAFSVKDYFKLNLLKFLVKGYRHASVYKGKAFYEALHRFLPVKSFEALKLPFFCNALSLTTGSMQYFGLPTAPRVALGDAIYASATLPGVFEPMQIDGDHFIDGGMAETLCLKLAHSRGADLIIAVDLGIKDHHVRTPYRATLPHILFQTYDLMGIALNEHNLHRFADDKVVLMRPKVGHIGVLDSPDVAELIRLGEREALEMLTTHHLTRHMCSPEAVEEVDRTISKPRDYVELNVDMNACINCGICAVTCATGGYANVPIGNVVRKLHNYECTRDLACERGCPTRAIRLQNL